jgi:hypothetical protein
MQDMTEEEALAEAIRRWGTSGAIRLRTDSSATGRVVRGRLARYRCVVGDGGLGEDRSIEGQGDTWREAFLDARPVSSSGSTPTLNDSTFDRLLS